jgi:hypothetical protein
MTTATSKDSSYWQEFEKQLVFVFEIEQAMGLRVGQQVDMFLVLSED